MQLGTRTFATQITFALLLSLALNLVLSLVSQGVFAGGPVAAKPKIAIIIDDLGYKLREGRRAIALPHSLTLAIIPASPHARKLAESANCTDNKEILVHLPMTPSVDQPWENGLDADMEQPVFSEKAAKLLLSVPYAIGANNHGGSLLTQDRERMNWLMNVLNEQNLFFVDSRTTAESVVVEAAQSANVQYGVRDVFLDNERNKAAIQLQLDKLVSHALKHGHAIAIGHPYPETLEVLEAALPEIQQQGIELVGISSLLERSAQKNMDEIAAIFAPTPSQKDLN